MGEGLVMGERLQFKMAHLNNCSNKFNHKI